MQFDAVVDFLLEYLSEKRDLYCSYRLKNGESRRRCAYDLINDIKREWENEKGEKRIVTFIRFMNVLDE